MKKILKNIKISALVVVTLIMATSSTKAQSFENVFLNFDWQLNAPVGSSFANQFSGWGANADGGYYLTKNIGIGAFISYHTNRKYLDKRTIGLGNSTDVTTDQQQSIYQLPFGLSARYSFLPESRVQPYFAVRLGTEYSKVATYMNVFEISEKKWGFYVSPEIGTNVYVDPQNRYAVHVAAYYSYSTNKSEVFGYDIDGINNLGFRIGLSF